MDGKVFDSGLYSISGWGRTLHKNMLKSILLKYFIGFSLKSKLHENSNIGNG